VAVSDVALGDPPLEQGRPAVQVAVGQALDRVGHIQREDRTHEGAKPGGVVLPQLPNRVTGGGGVDVRRRLRLSVEGGDHTGDPPQLGPDLEIVTYEAGQPAGGGHAPHGHQMVQGLPVRAADRQNPQVDVGGEPAVELHFPVAKSLPAFPGREVDKRHPHGLLQLVVEARGTGLGPRQASASSRWSRNGIRRHQAAGRRRG
jgi:hypothetical protein